MMYRFDDDFLEHNNCVNCVGRNKDNGQICIRKSDMYCMFTSEGGKKFCKKYENIYVASEKINVENLIEILLE